MISALLAFTTAFAGPAAANFDAERQVDRAIPDDAAMVRVVQAHGDCLVVPLPADSSAHATLTIDATGENTRQEREFLEQLDLSVRVLERGVYEVAGIYPEADSKPPKLSFATKLKLWLPRTVAVDVDNRFGSVEVTDRGAAVSIKNRLGAVTVRDVEGHTSITNEYDKVQVTNVDGALEITNSGDVEVTGVTGQLNVNNKFGSVTLASVGGLATIENRNAPILLRKMEGPCIVTAPYCSVTAEDTEEDLRIDGNNGRVEVLRARGRVELKHRHGQLVLEEISGDVVIQGNLSPTLVRKVGGDLNLTCPASSVQVENVTGDASVEVLNGSTKIRDVHGSLIARGKGGLMHVICAAPLSGSPRILDLENRTAPIELELSPASSCKLSAQSTLGTIESEFPDLNIERTGRIATGTLVLGSGDVAVRAICIDGLIRISVYHEE